MDHTGQTRLDLSRIRLKGPAAASGGGRTPEAAVVLGLAVTRCSLAPALALKEGGGPRHQTSAPPTRRNLHAGLLPPRRATTSRRRTRSPQRHGRAGRNHAISGNAPPRTDVENVTTHTRCCESSHVLTFSPHVCADRNPPGDSLGLSVP